MTIVNQQNEKNDQADKYNYQDYQCSIQENVVRFTDKCTDNCIEFEYSGISTWINMYYVDKENCKLYAFLLKSAINKMKSLGCKEFKQLVLESDWDNFLSENKEWEVLEKNPGNNYVPATLLTKCNIDDAYELILDGALRNNKNTDMFD